MLSRDNQCACCIDCEAHGGIAGDLVEQTVLHTGCSEPASTASHCKHTGVTAASAAVIFGSDEHNISATTLSCKTMRTLALVLSGLWLLCLGVEAKKGETLVFYLSNVMYVVSTCITPHFSFTLSLLPSDILCSFKLDCSLASWLLV